jgi:hypothetical protein
MADFNAIAKQFTGMFELLVDLLITTWEIRADTRLLLQHFRW